MHTMLTFSTASIWVLVLYLLNKVFNYKDKLIKHFGIIKYKITLFTIYILVFVFLKLSFSIEFSNNLIPLSIFLSYIYLITIPKYLR